MIENGAHALTAFETPAGWAHEPDEAYEISWRRAIELLDHHGPARVAGIEVVAASAETPTGALHAVWKRAAG
ncbi:hypothetical protein AB0C33_46545 [Nonomuraea sp. NPDC048881]|uniref:hypothetical protein n=1 Tax=Nonomuraea sp. NPDC048881 TaxID=3155030 RepID=UPI0033D98229